MTFDQINVDDHFTTAEIEVSEESIRAFAAEYDPQPMHLDEEAARQSFFGGLIASGWQTCVLTMKLIVEARIFGATPLIGVQVDEIRFEKPVRPGDRIHAEATVVKKTSSKRTHRQFVSLEVATRGEDGTVILTQKWTLLIP